MPLIGLLALIACRPTPLPPPVVAAAPTPQVLFETELPADARSRYLEAAVAERLGHLDRAEAAYRWVTRLDSSNPWAWLALGRFVERQRRWPEALDAYQRAIARDDTLAEAHLAAGSCAVRSGDITAGLAHLERASALGDPNAHHLYVRALSLAGRRDEGLVVLQQWLHEPVTGELTIDRARLSYELGLDDAVIDDLIHADWLLAPPPAADLLLDAAVRSCRLGDAWLIARGNAFATRSEPRFRAVAAHIAELTADRALLLDAEPSLTERQLTQRIDDAANAKHSTAHCEPPDIAPGCAGLDAAWQAWNQHPTSLAALEIVEDRARACGNTDSSRKIEQFRRWLSPTMTSDRR